MKSSERPGRAQAQADQRVIEPDPERDRAEELELLERRLQLLETPTDPNAGPSASFARGIRHLEMMTMIGQPVERIRQAHAVRYFKPSRKLEEDRFRLPGLPRSDPWWIWSRRPPDANPAKKDMLAAVAAYRGPIDLCPAETTTTMLEAQRNKRPVGRPRVHPDHAMSAAERKRRQREKLRVLTTPPQQQQEGDANVVTINQQPRHNNIDRLDRGGGGVDPRAKPKAA